MSKLRELNIKAIIYDMDGVLVDSEPIWQEAEINIFREVDVSLTREMCLKTQGMRIDEVVKFWYKEYQWKTITCKEIENKIVDEVIRLILQKGTPMIGVRDSLNHFKSKGYKIALASSSFMSIINTVLDKLDIRDFFDVVHSAEFEEYGKPHPAIYLTTAKELGVDPTECVAIEDSFFGMVAALSAKMYVVAIPEDIHMNEDRFKAAHQICKNLNDTLHM